jgi:hypothetical protein
MRSGISVRHGGAGAGVPRQALALLLGGTALFLAVENAILLFVLGPSVDWPAGLEPLALALRVARVLAQAFAPWVVIGLGATLAGAAALWAALRIRDEVNHA